MGLIAVPGATEITSTGLFLLSKMCRVGMLGSLNTIHSFTIIFTTPIASSLTFPAAFDCGVNMASKNPPWSSLGVLCSRSGSTSSPAHRPQGHDRVVVHDPEQAVVSLHPLSSWGYRLCQNPLSPVVVLYKGKPITFTEDNVSTRVVRASYGVMSLLRMRHIAALKHHYLSTPTIKSMLIPKGRMRGGMARRDAVITSDMATTVVCSHCRKLTINCDCPSPKPPPTEIMVRYGLVILDVYLTVATLNTPDKGTYSVAYFTRITTEPLRAAAITCNLKSVLKS
ncbi:hypothetical protein BU26DRAFT_571814 [Trematosphaeria pertusa]|uniref:Uncharacterized protein n=1 Tax=Trematosphaeria pertusa TaxID=390896 RepID=A0A6A6HTG8_9PLEO|nr:uncharacterized protein BU26DRAFT_571814 [Trematosphaeria pertusa]KAF2241311.1 hypothetical protein BU26DRAFT_571814 [Trematosphaeria pertusa]